MYKLESWRQAKKFLSSNKCSNSLNKFLIDEIEELTKEPEKGDQLVGNLRDYWSLRLIYFGVEYRIFYYISQEDNRIVVCCIGNREEAYEKFKRLVASKH